MRFSRASPFAVLRREPGVTRVASAETYFSVRVGTPRSRYRSSETRNTHNAKRPTFSPTLAPVADVTVLAVIFEFDFVYSSLASTQYYTTTRQRDSLQKSKIFTYQINVLNTSRLGEGVEGSSSLTMQLAWKARSWWGTSAHVQKIRPKRTGYKKYGFLIWLNWDKSS